MNESSDILIDNVIDNSLTGFVSGILNWLKNKWPFNNSVPTLTSNSKIFHGFKRNFEPADRCPISSKIGRRERFFRRGGNCIQAINFRIGNGYDNAGCDLVLKFIIKVKPLSKSLILGSRPLFSGRAIIKAGGTVGGGGGGNFPQLLWAWDQATCW